MSGANGGQRFNPEVLSQIMRSVVEGTVTSRAGLARSMDMARSTIGLAVDFLLDKGLLEENDNLDGMIGRPARSLVCGPNCGTVGVVAFSYAGLRVAVADIASRIIVQETLDIPLATGAERSIQAAAAALTRMQSELAGRAGPIHQVVLSVPAPVNYASGSVERSLTREIGRHPMVGWEQLPLSKMFQSLVDAQVILDNDANLFALNDARTLGTAALPLVRIHLSVGIGAGMVDADGGLYRGAGGVAGDIGHIATQGMNQALCWCGKQGCIGAVGTLQSVFDDLGIANTGGAGIQLGVDALSSRLRNGEAQATQRVMTAAAAIGELAAVMVDILNPATLVFGGEIASLGSDVIARVRSVVYERAMPIASRKLNIVSSEFGPEGALLGGAHAGAERMLTPVGIQRQLGWS